jgi:hypothetical protein
LGRFFSANGEDFGSATHPLQSDSLYFKDFCLAKLDKLG